MPEEKWVVLTTCYEIEADVITALLESSGIEVKQLNEAYGHLGGFKVGPMAEVKLLVKAEDEQKAREILEADIEENEEEQK